MYVMSIDGELDFVKAKRTRYDGCEVPRPSKWLGKKNKTAAGFIAEMMPKLVQQSSHNKVSVVRRRSARATQ